MTEGEQILFEEEVFVVSKVSSPEISWQRGAKRILHLLHYDGE
jgi:hypothetical protein